MKLYEVERQFSLSHSIFSGLVIPTLENSEGDVAFKWVYYKLDAPCYSHKDNNIKKPDEFLVEYLAQH